MKRNFTFLRVVLSLLMIACFLLSATSNGYAQTTPVLGDPAYNIYGMTAAGEIYEFKTSNGDISKTIKNSTYPVRPASNANGLAYNISNGNFYYFKRNFGATNPEFVSFDPKTNTVTVLAASTIAGVSNTGSISPDGKGFYTIDMTGLLSYYDIANNTWQTITSDLKDNYGMDVDSVVRALPSGDVAFDANGNLWVVASSGANYGVYRIPGPLPKTSVSQLTVTRVLPPTSVTPLNGSTPDAFAGIAFDISGNIFISTVLSELWRLDNASTLHYVGSLGNDFAGGDLTSANFPAGAVLPVTWTSFDASHTNSNVLLNWKVAEQNNKGFYIQESGDGVHWTEIGFVKDKGTGTEESYSYTFSSTVSGKQYYRLRQVDLDGKESFSTVRTVTIGESVNGFALWPNPATTTIHLSNKSIPDNGNLTISVHDMSGRLRMQQTIPGNSSVDVSKLEREMFIVRVRTAEGGDYSWKMVKE